MTWLTDFVGLVFPEYCLMCNGGLARNEPVVCLHCRHALPLADYHRHPDNELARRFAGKVEVAHAWAYLKFTKGGIVQNALHQLKYNGKQDVGRLLGGWFGVELKKAGLHTEIDCVVPVPLHPSKLKKRGYNQCDPIADGLARELGAVWHPHALRRNLANRTQTKLGRMERYENTKRIFETNPDVPVAGKRVLLVDDVVTTGSTLEAAAAALLNGGCRQVSIACLAAAQ